VITELGADGGTIGDPNDTPTGTPDPAEVPGDLIIKDFNDATTVQVIVDDGFDKIDFFSTGDIFQVASGAEFYARQVDANPNLPDPSEFVAMGNTTNAGVAVLEDSFGGGLNVIIDVSAAGGANGFSLIGSTSNVAGQDTLIGSEQNDIINGGNSMQTVAAAIDVLTGNGGADLFEFDLSISDAATLIVETTTPGKDVEQITFSADATVDGNESMLLNYTLNGIADSTGQIDLTVVDVTDPTAVAALVAGVIEAKAGISASAAGAVVSYWGDSAAATVFGGAATVNYPMPVFSDGTDDVAQISTVTVDGTPSAGDAYSLLVQGPGGDSANYIGGQGGDPLTSDAVAAGLEADFTDSVDITATVAGSVITFTDGEPENAGFEIQEQTTSVFLGSGASIKLNGADSDLNTADIITDFTAADDSIAFAGLPAGTTGNFGSGAEVAGDDFSDVYDDAVAAMHGTNVIYYLGSIQGDLVDANGNLGLDFTNETVGLLFFDANGDENPDGVVALIGVNSTNFSHLDIVAG